MRKLMSEAEVNTATQDIRKALGPTSYADAHAQLGLLQDQCLALAEEREKLLGVMRTQSRWMVTVLVAAGACYLLSQGEQDELWADMKTVRQAVEGEDTPDA